VISRRWVESMRSPESGKYDPVRPIRFVLAVLTLMVPACGDGEDSATPETIRRAAEKTLGSGSAAFAQRISFLGSDIPEDTGIVGNGAAVFDQPRQMQAVFDFGQLRLGRIEIIVDDTTMYIRGGRIAEVAGDADTWVEIDLTSDNPAAQELQDLASGQSDPSLLLSYLFGTTGEVEPIGTRSVDGVETAGYRASVDLVNALEQAPSEHRESLRLNIEEIQQGGGETELDAEVWIDDDGFVRRTIYEYVGVDQLGGGVIRAVSDLSAFGEPVELRIPEPDDVVTIENAG
jgi:hypothetical protein